MKLTTLLLMAALMHIAYAGRGQITLSENKAPLDKVLADIEKQSKYVFLYDPDELKTITITVSVKNATIQQTLDKCFKGLPVEYSMVGNNVLLKKKRPASSKTISDIPIRGRVMDSAGLPLAGVTVMNYRERRGTETDTGGVFTLPGAKGDVFRFSFVGFKDRAVVIGDQPSIDVSLEVNSSIADQVVVVGYGSSKRKDLTGAVSVVDVRDFDEIPFNTFDNALAGKATGVEVTKTDGTPGGMARVRIRGTSSLLGGNDPLYVINGVPVQVRSDFIDPGFLIASPASNLANGLEGRGAALPESFVNGLNSLGGLNIGDIESITVLKDASSTAIYGSKATNGVVLITTKTGNVNAPPRITLNYSTTVSSAYKTPKLLNASQYKTLLTEAAENANAEDSIFGFPLAFFTQNILDSPTFFGTANTNWIRQVTRSTVSNNAGVSVSGGSQASKYFSSFSYSNTPGVVNGTGLRRISGNLTLETKIGSKLTFATNLLAGFTDQSIGDGAYAQALLARPDFAARDASGNYVDFDGQALPFGGILNPVAILTATNNGKTTSLLGSISGEYAIINGLRFKSAVSLNMQNYNQRNFLPGYIDLDVFTNNTVDPGGIGANANSRFADWFLENTLTYNKQFNNHGFNVVIGQSYETTKYSYFRATASGYPNNTTLTGLSSALTPLSVSGDEPASPQNYLLSFYARANYSYLDKYLFTLTGRADGSSKFGPNNKFGYFPSAAIAWRLSQESFLKNIRWLNDLKLRTSYGLTGNQNIGDQMYRTLYSPASYAGNSALVPTQLGNEGIKWESTKQADIGLDMSLFSGRLDATFDYYNKQTNDALLWMPIAASTSYSSLLENSVGLRNRGLEASVAGHLIRTKDFSWTASVTVTWNNSLVTRLNAGADLSQINIPSLFETAGDSLNGHEGSTTILQGKPLGLITGQVVTGVIRTQAQLDAYTSQLGSNARYYYPKIGALMYKLDASTAGQGYENPLSGAVIANGAPAYYGGMTQDVSYKRFSIRCYFTFSHGGHLLWAEHVGSTEFFGTANADRLMLNRYTTSNTNSNAPTLNLDDFYNASNLDVFSSSYVKLRSLTINYCFGPSGWMKKAAVSNAQIYVSATNIFTLTKYPGSDPETLDDPYAATGGYVDAGNYPAIRTFSIGLKAIF